ncbi:MAG: RHS domain-containing protein [Gammaproteobacteria bacterium]|nr:RHS domain-containing protein [Gammaproteobacteria bacterium]
MKPMMLVRTAAGLAALFFSGIVFAAAPVRYDEPGPDLVVKVLGGKLIVQRSFYEGRWYLNQNWAPLSITFDSFDGSVKSIERGRATYTRLAPGVFRDNAYYTIRQTPTGFTWTDRAGNTLNYDASGNVLSYSDRNGVGGTFLSETVNNIPRLTGINDHLGNPALRFEYSGDDVTRVYDRTHREVRYGYNADHALSDVTDANGHIWTYGYGNGVPTTFTDPENRTVTRTWASNGELASIRYADNTGVDYIHDYDSSKNVYYTQEKTTGGRITETWMTLDQQLLRKDLNGKTVETHVPETPHVRSRTATDARNLTTTQALDEWGNITKTTYPDGTTTSTTYDPVYSNPLTTTTELGVITKFEYDPKGNLLRMTEALGLPEQRMTEYTYDQYGQRKTVKRLGDAVTQEALTQYEYDTYGNLTKVTDAENNVTQYPSADYDVMGNSKKKIDARTKMWTQTYDNKGNVLTQTDPLLHINTLVYDKSDWLSSVKDAVNNVTQFTFDARHNLLTITDPYGAVMSFEFNHENQQIKVTDVENKVTQNITYDLQGRLNQKIDGNGNVTQYVYGDAASGMNNLLVKTIYPTYTQEYKYDLRNRIVESINLPDANTRLSSKSTYDAAGNIITTTDENAKTTTNTYDAFSRFKATADTLQGVITYNYDNRNNLLNVKDPKGQNNGFTYDRLNRKLSESKSLRQTITYTYLATGQLENKTDAKGQIKHYSYDDVGRMTGETYFHSATDLANNVVSKSITYSLSGNNRLTGYGDGMVIATISYDAKQRRKTNESINYGIFTLTYSYDYLAFGKKKSFTRPDGVTASYTYDANNQLATIQLPSGNITVNSYKWFAPAQITYPGGSVAQQKYDPLMRLQQIQVKDPGQTELMNYQYGYDNIGNITNKTTEHGNYTYTYDDLYRLKTASNPSPLFSEDYTYDAVGNRLSDSKTTGTWGYNENNQLIGVDNITYDYDANGNMVKKTNATDPTQTRNYVFDINDRLVEIRDQNNTLIVTYTYDPFGRRIAKDTGGNKTYFLYADEGLIAEADANGVVTKQYGYKPNSTWVTDPIYLNEGANTYYYQNDHLGTSQKLLASNGSVVWNSKSDAFGNTQIDPASTITNNLRFSGQYYDAESRLNYNLNRYYDPQIGRYISSDPIGLSGGINGYVYVENNPFQWVDPSGLAPMCMKPDDCGKLLADIIRKYALLHAELLKYDPVLDGRGGFPMRGGKITKPGGHYQEIQDLQRGIKNDITRYKEECSNNGGPGVPPSVPRYIDDAANRPVAPPVIPAPATPSGQPSSGSTAPSSPATNESAPGWGAVGVTVLVGGSIVCAILEPCGAAVATALAGTGGLVAITQ